MWTIAQNTTPALPITIRNGSLTLQSGILVAALRWQIAGGSLTAAAGTLTESTGADTGNYMYRPGVLETATVGLCLLSHATLTVSPGEVQVVAASSDAYLSVADALALAATMGGAGLTRFLAKDAATQAGLLLLASIDVDAAGRWQGGKYDPLGTITGAKQVREFPRVVGNGPLGNFGPYPAAMPGVTTPGYTDIFDWDPAANNGQGAVVVPAEVKTAVLYQCEWLCQPRFARRLEDIKSGLASQGIGSGSESYADKGGLGGSTSFASDGLCERASRLLARFRLSTGRIL